MYKFGTGTLFLFVFLLGCSSVQKTERVPASDTTPTEFKNIFSNPAQFKTMEQVITALPAEMKKDYLIGFNSRSVQEATKKEPRILMRNANGTALATFNGGNQFLRGYDSMEFLFLKPDGLGYEMRELKISAQGGRLSEANPKKCLSCHGSNPGPLWDDYFVWAGFIGGNDDRIFKEVGKKTPIITKIQSAYLKVLKETHGVDADVLNEFSNSSNTRYKLLSPLLPLPQAEDDHRFSLLFFDRVLASYYVSRASEIAQKIKAAGLQYTALTDIESLSNIPTMSNKSINSTNSFNLGAEVEARLNATGEALGIPFLQKYREALARKDRATRFAESVKAQRFFNLHGSGFQGHEEVRSNGRRVESEMYTQTTLAYIDVLFEYLGLTYTPVTTEFFPLNEGLSTGEEEGGFNFRPFLKYMLSPAADSGEHRTWGPITFNVIEKYDDRTKYADENRKKSELEQLRNKQTLTQKFNSETEIRRLAARKETERSVFAKNCAQCHFNGVPNIPMDVRIFNFDDPDWFHNLKNTNKALLGKMRDLIRLPATDGASMPSGQFLDGETRKYMLNVLDRMLAE